MGTCLSWDWMWAEGERASTGKPATQSYLCRFVSSGTVWAASWPSMLSATVRGPRGTALAAAAGRGASAVPRCGQAGGWEKRNVPVCVSLKGGGAGGSPKEGSSWRSCWQKGGGCHLRQGEEAGPQDPCDCYVFCSRTPLWWWKRTAIWPAASVSARATSMSPAEWRMRTPRGRCHGNRVTPPRMTVRLSPSTTPSSPGNPPAGRLHHSITASGRVSHPPAGPVTSQSS